MPTGRPKRSVLICAVLLLLTAWGVRVAVMGAHQLHPDEALYGHFGLLIQSGRDPWLATVPIRKPPLQFYLIAGSLALLGRSVWAVRLPGLLAGMATVGLAGRLAYRLYRNNLAGLAALAIVALSPLAILFSATSRTDPLMVALGVAAYVAAVEGKPGLTGVLAGLSFAAKRVGVVWLPLAGLLIVAAETAQPRSATGNRRMATALIRGALGFLAIAALIMTWDRVRVAQGAYSFWPSGVADYGGLRTIWASELVPRLQEWMGWLRHLFGSPLLNGLLIAGTAAVLVRGIWRMPGGVRAWHRLFDWVLTGFCVTYMMIHWLWAFPVWSRYLLPLIPPAAVLAGRVVSALTTAIADKVSLKAVWARSLALVAIVIGLAAPAAGAVAGEVQAGAGWAVYDGIEQVADFLRTAPEGSVLYHHWLGWDYSFYLYDAPLYLAYWPTPAWLVQDVQAFAEAEPRYIVFPAWESRSRVEAALAKAGYRMEPVYQARGKDGEVRFDVYQITATTTPDGSQRRPAGRCLCKRSTL